MNEINPFKILQQIIDFTANDSFYNTLDKKDKERIKTSLEYYLNGKDIGFMFVEKMLFNLIDNNSFNSEFNFTKDDIKPIIDSLSKNPEKISYVFRSNSLLLNSFYEVVNVE